MKSLENNGQLFNILLGNNTYHIKQNQSTSDSWLMCPSGSIANVAFCGKIRIYMCILSLFEIFFIQINNKDKYKNVYPIYL